MITLLPPHLSDSDIEDQNPDYTNTKTFTKFGRQGPSKYGKGGSRAYKALGRKQAKKQPKK